MNTLRLVPSGLLIVAIPITIWNKLGAHCRGKRFVNARKQMRRGSSGNRTPLSMMAMVGKGIQSRDPSSRDSPGSGA